MEDDTMKNYDIRIASYTRTNGKRFTVVSFSDEAKARLSNSSYWKLWGKGTRLYFLPSTPSQGRPITSNGSIQYDSNEWVDALKKFEGEYPELLYDETLHYEYIDIEHKGEVKRTDALGKGKPTSEFNRPATHTVSGRFGRPEEEPKVVEAKTVAPNEAPKTEVKPDAKSLLTEMLLSKVDDGNMDDAQSLAKVIRML